jgi:uncharacterized protein (TIGR00369 family)
MSNESLEELLRHHLEVGGFHQFLGMELVDFSKGEGTVTIRLPFREDFERGPGTRQWHGGPIAALIDIAGDFALLAKLERGVPTVNLRIDYVRPAIDTSLTARGRVIRSGRTVGLVDIELTDDAGRVVAVGRGSYLTTSGP